MRKILKKTMNTSHTTMMMGLVITCMKVKLMSAPSILHQLHLTHKDITCHQGLPSNPPPACRSTILWLHPPPLCTPAIPQLHPPPLCTPAILQSHPHIVNPPSNLHLAVGKAQSSCLSQLRVARVQSIHRLTHMTQWTTMSMKRSLSLRFQRSGCTWIFPNQVVMKLYLNQKTSAESRAESGIGPSKCLKHLFGHHKLQDHPLAHAHRHDRQGP